MTALAPLDCAWLLADPGKTAASPDMRISIDGEHIASVDSLPVPVAGPRRLVLPALANAHDHARTFRSATLGAFGQPLESWLPFLGVLPPLDPYLCAATSFARSMRNGVSHLMVHYTRVQGGLPYLQEVQAVARAARDVGVRIGFAVAMRDKNGIGLCHDDHMLAALRPSLRDCVAKRLGFKPMPAAWHMGVVDEVASMLESDSTFANHVTPQYGPAGVQWCSQALLEAVAEGSVQHDRPVHMHLLETRYQREWADHNYPNGMVKFLDEIGLLSPRLTLAHCTWARSEELALLAERGVTIAVNTSSNLGLKSGIAPLAEMLRLGCRVAMGLDGTAFDEDDDALREMRLGYALHRGWGFESEVSRSQLWTFAAQNGRRSVSGGQADSQTVGQLVPGAPADFLILNWDALDNDALFAGIDPFDLLLARGTGRYIDEVFVGGRRRVSQGRLIALDEAAMCSELLDQARTKLAAEPGHDVWRVTLGELAEDLGPFYRRSAWSGCC